MRHGIKVFRIRGRTSSSPSNAYTIHPRPLPHLARLRRLCRERLDLSHFTSDTDVFELTNGRGAEVDERYEEQKRPSRIQAHPLKSASFSYIYGGAIPAIPTTFARTTKVSYPL